LSYIHHSHFLHLFVFLLFGNNTACKNEKTKISISISKIDAFEKINLKKVISTIFMQVENIFINKESTLQ
jgi:hypothetical protein